MSLPRAVRQFSILHFFSDPHECHCLALFMHPPPKEFGAMLHDCLSVDPLVQSSILHFFSEPHECHCLALFMCPPRSSLEPRECDCLALFANAPFSTSIWSPMNVIA